MYTWPSSVPPTVFSEDDDGTNSSSIIDERHQTAEWNQREQVQLSELCCLDAALKQSDSSVIHTDVFQFVSEHLNPEMLNLSWSKVQLITRLSHRSSISPPGESGRGRVNWLQCLGGSELLKGERWEAGGERSMSLFTSIVMSSSSRRGGCQCLD